MLGQVHEYELLIREQHLDTFGHVNNAAYLQILEEARWDLITADGYGLFDLTTRKLMLPTPEWIAALGVRPDALK